MTQEEYAAAEEYLMQARMLNKKIDNKVAELEQLRSLADGVGSPVAGEKVQTSSSGDRMEATVIKILGMEEDVRNELARLMDLRKDIIDTIEQLKDPIEYHILHMYYVQEKSIRQIQHKVTYSKTGVIRVKERAIRHVSEILDQKCTGVNLKTPGAV